LGGGLFVDPDGRKKMEYVKRLDEMTKEEYQETGGKAANLGELIRHAFNVPGGFCVTGKSLDYLFDSNGLQSGIMEITGTMNFDNYGDIESKSARIRGMIADAPIPEDLLIEIKQQINSLKSPDGEDPFVAVRSSVAVKGSTISSFPGMMDTYHFIKGEGEIIENIRRCWASLFTARAVYRRHQQEIPQDKGVIAPIVQKMVNADVAGVMFTANPINSSRDEIVIEANWGLGESLVSGEAIVDYFVLTRDTPPLLKEKRVQNKNIMVTIDREKGIGRKKYELTGSMITDCTLTDEQLLELAEMGPKIEELFEYPQDIEWAYEKGKLFVLQSRKIKGLKS
jgi:pyruvate,water dikinase